MPNYRLGLDMGSSSIGWCAVELDSDGCPSRVLDAGVRILSPHIAAGRDPKSMASLAADRRKARGMRRRRDRFLRRQQRLMDVLVRVGLMPKNKSERKELEKLDPYWLRKEALYKPLEAYEIGRALFHLNQRRGFRSNRITDSESKEKSNIESAVKNLVQQINNEGASTLGEFLANRHRTDKFGKRLHEGPPPELVRFRPTPKGSKNLYDFYPTRDLVKDEIEKIWNGQKDHHPNLLTSDLLKEIQRIIIDQRPLKKQEVGRCTFLSEKMIDNRSGLEIDLGERAPKAHPLFQTFRILDDVSRLRIMRSGYRSRPLRVEQFDAVVGVLANPSSSMTTFEKLRKVVNGLGEDEYFNFEHAGRKGLAPDQTADKLRHKKAFGTHWHELSRDEKISVVERLLHVEDAVALQNWLQGTFKISQDQAEYISELRLPQGHGQFGRAALDRLVKILETEQREDSDPETGEVFMRRLTYAEATMEFGQHHSDFAPRHAGRCGKLPYYGELFPRHVIARPSAPSGSQERIGRVSNPTVHIGLNQLRKVVNAIIDAHGPPDEVVVELARELKLNQKQKQELNQQNIKNEEKNSKIVRELDEMGLANTYHNRLLLRLYDELPPEERVCVFSGVVISKKMLFGPGIQIEHVVPRSIAEDDSFNNKVLCTIASNQKKANRIPSDAWNGSELSDICNRAARLFPHKAWRFFPDAIEKSGDIHARHLTDTQHLSKLTKSYLEHACEHVWSTPGRLTAMLRAKWGLNTLLPDHNYANTSHEKNRKDHRHHAIDAFVVACTDRSMLNRISREAGQAEKLNLDRPFPKGKFPTPYTDYRDDLKQRLETLIVSHKQDHGIAPGAQAFHGTTSGKLLDETAYGIANDEIDGTVYNLVSRKPIENLTTAEINRIRDPHLREKIQKELQSDEHAEDRVNLKAALAKFAQDHGIRKIRILELTEHRYTRKIEHGSIDESNKEVNHHFSKIQMLSDNHRIEIFELNGKWKGEAVSVFDANQPGFNSSWRSDHPNAKPVMRIHKGDLIEADFGSGQIVYRVCNLDASSSRIKLAPHNEAGSLRTRHTDKEDPFSYEMKAYSKLQAAGAIRIQVDPIGRKIFLKEFA